jgi:2-C-methyl-D-erythritol 4-phosphate cytidylyltransferase
MTLSPRFFCLIPAAGIGSRVGAEQPKQYVLINGKPMLQYVLEAFSACDSIHHTFVLVAEGDCRIDRLLADASHLSGRVSVLSIGGKERRDTVFNALQSLRPAIHDDDWILIHDAARPGLKTEMISELIKALSDDPVGGLFALPVVDTIKQADSLDRTQGTIPRDGLWLAQTPQMFRYRLLLDALSQKKMFTDEAGAVEALGLHPKLVSGYLKNFKVTQPDDIELAALYLRPLK